MKNIFFLSIALIFITLQSSNAQKILTTESGQEIRLELDGSWEVVTQESKTATDGTTDLSSFEAPKKGKYPITPEQKKVAETLLSTLLVKEAKARVNVENIESKIKSESLLIDNAKSRKDKVKEEQSKILLNKYKGEKKEADKTYKTSYKLVKKVKDILEGKVKNFQSGIASIDPNQNQPKTSNVNNNTNPTSSESTSYKVDYKNYPRTFKVSEKKNRNSTDDCELEFNGTDTSLGAKRKSVKPAFFFGFTQPKLKSFFRSDDYLTANANVSKIGGKYFITLNLRVKSKDASRNYGYIDQNESLRITTIDGDNIYGKAVSKSEGTIEPYSGHTLYKVMFKMNKGELKSLKNSYIDRVGLMWSSGFEEYEIYNVDFFQKQVKCLEN